jgi:hypothetical protein
MSADDLTPEERQQQEEDYQRRQFESNLPADERSFYYQPDVAKTLVPYGYKPRGPYSDGNMFIMRKKETGKVFHFGMPRRKSDNKPDPDWLRALKDYYCEYHGVSPDESGEQMAQAQTSESPVDTAMQQKTQELRQQEHEVRMAAKNLDNNRNLAYYPTNTSSATLYALQEP